MGAFKTVEATTRVTAEPAVLVDRVAKIYQRGRFDVHALREASLTVRDGEFVAIMGPSGSGKSTLLQLIAGLDVPTGGTIDVKGQRVSAMNDDQATAFRRTHVGFVYQSFNLLPDLTIEENVGVPLMLDGRDPAEIRTRVAAALEQVGLEDRKEHLPAEVSGGELQRASLARAFVTEPVLLLADEPTGNLDSVSGDQVMLQMRETCDELGRTIVLVTHDARAAAYADRIARLLDGRFQNS